MKASHMDGGEYIIDREDDDPDLAVVVQRPEKTISEVPRTDADDENRTIADDNPTYNEDEPAVVVAFVDSGLDAHWPEWQTAAAGELFDGAQEHGVKLYTFPEARLTPVEENDVTTFRQESTVAMDELEHRLDDAAWETSRENGTLRAKKLNETYRIHRDGTVDGTGDLQEPLENLVDQYCG